MNDNFETSLRDAATTAPMSSGTMVVGGVFSVVGLVLAAIPITAGTLFLKDRWSKKGKRKAKDK